MVFTRNCLYSRSVKGSAQPRNGHNILERGFHHKKDSIVKSVDGQPRNGYNHNILEGGFHHEKFHRIPLVRSEPRNGLGIQGGEQLWEGPLQRCWSPWRQLCSILIPGERKEEENQRKLNTRLKALLVTLEKICVKNYNVQYFVQHVQFLYNIDDNEKDKTPGHPGDNFGEKLNARESDENPKQIQFEITMKNPKKRLRKGEKEWKPEKNLEKRMKTWQPPRLLSAPLQTSQLQLHPPPQHNKCKILYWKTSKS